MAGAARWLGYSRVSRVGDRGDRLISPELQAERIEGFAGSRGWEVEVLPPELDVSGGKVSRPVLDDAIAAVRDGLYAGIIVAQLDRLSRMDITDALKTIQRIEEHGGQVVAVAENFDPTTPEGRMVRNILLSVGDMQLGRYRLGFITVKARAVREGIWPMSRVPLGYEKGEDRKLALGPRAADVEEAMRMRAAGRSWPAVADHLRVGVSSARAIVHNRVYLGEIHLSVDGQPIANRKAHPAIVDRATFEAAQEKQVRPPRAGNAPALLGGLVRCAECGYVMTRSSKRSRPGVKKTHFYVCRARKATGLCPAPAIVGAVGLDALVERTVLAELASLRFSARQRTGDVDAALANLETAEHELTVFQEATSASGVGAEHFASGIRSRVAAVEDARRGVAEARLRAAPVPDPGDLLALWPDLTVTERRHVLRGSLSAVVVRKGTGELARRVRVFDPSAALTYPLPSRNLPGEVRLALT